MNNECLSGYNISGERRNKKMERKLYKRETYLKKIRGFYHDTDVIKVFTGVRRCGKSSIMTMNFLAKADAEDNLMRIMNIEVATELMEMTFGRENTRIKINNISSERLNK